MSDTASKAVFLSYASQDAEAARRMADALRAAGLEVWFDRSELRGGDAWDASIRQQIQSCALFVPVISANTQSRPEGYFRLEWKLAVDRSHLMSDDHPFFVPVVIDDTPDATARVPAGFRARQWTRLPGGETPPAFCDRVQRLLGGSATVPGVANPGPASPRPATTKRHRSRRIGLLAGLATVALAATAIIWRPWDRAAASVPGLGSSEADQLVRQARELLYDPDAARHEFALAENLVKRATDLAPTSAAAWGASALVNYYTFFRGYDTNRQRLVRSRTEAEKALVLDPRNVDALLALGFHRQEQRELDRAKELFERARAVDPQNPRVLLAQGLLIADRNARTQFLLDAAGRAPRPAELLYYAALGLAQVRRFGEAIPIAERSLAAQPFWRMYSMRAYIEYMQSADPAKVIAWLDRVPDLKSDEPRVALMRFKAAMLRGDGAAAERALSPLASDYLEDNFFIGPKSFLLAQAYEISDPATRATEQWNAAERIVRERIAAEPGNPYWRAMLAVILTGEKNPTEARAAAEACAADDRIDDVKAGSRVVNQMLATENTALAFTRLGDGARAIELLRRAPYRTNWGYVSAATLGADPAWAPLRGQPGYAELVAEMKRAEREEAGSVPAAVTPSDRPPIDPKSIAVLPFANLSPDPENAFFCDGVHDDVITGLAKIRDLRVISRTSMLAYRDPALRNLKKIAAELGVANVLEGSVRRAGNKVRVSAQLIDARTDAHLWAETYDGDLTDIFALQAKLAQQIAGALQATLTGSERALIERRPTENQEAYDLFLRARAMQQEQGELGTLADFERIVTVYDQAIAKDPAFALAHAQVAQVHAIIYWFGFLDPSPARAERMKTAVDAAVRLAPDAPETHVALGSFHYRVGLDWNRALTEFRLAEAGLPNDPQLRFWLAVTHRRLGHWAESAEYFARAVALNPRDLASTSNFTLYLSVLHRWELARAATEKALAYFPTSRELLQNKARIAFALDGDVAAYARATEMLPPSGFDPAGATDKFEAALLRDDLDAARRALDQLGQGRMLEWYGNVIADPVTFHQTYVAFLRGDRDAAGQLADQTIAHYRGESWNTRQQPWVRMRIAQLEAWAGRTDGALRDGQAALTAMMAQDAMGGAQLRQFYGLVLVSLDQREEALACLRQVMAGPSTKSANEIRVDPLWSRLKDDPRFEVILQSARPL